MCALGSLLVAVIQRRTGEASISSALSAALAAHTHVKPVMTHSDFRNTRMLSSLMQDLAIEPLALVVPPSPNLTSGSLPLRSVVMSPHKEPPTSAGKSISTLKHLKGEQMQQAAATNHFQSHSLCMRMLSFLTHCSIAYPET